jgi:hypothetical protein
VKAALALQLHNQHFVYDDDPDVQKRVMTGVKSVGDFERNLLTVHRGTCNYAGTHLGLMWRMVGLPTRFVSGSVAGSIISRRGDTHLWPEYWNGTQWIAGEGADTVMAPWVRPHIVPEGEVPLHDNFLSISQVLAQPGALEHKSRIARQEAVLKAKEVIQLLLRIPEDWTTIRRMLSTKEGSRELADLIDVVMLESFQALEQVSHGIVDSQKRRIWGSKKKP